jgi:arabinofuranan 3-O-arabinosyltransferase
MSRRRLSLFAPYAVVVGIGAGVAQTWFHAGRFIASGDLPPFLFDRHRTEYLALWNHGLSGAGGRSLDIASAPLEWWSRGVHGFGGSDMLAQRLLVSLMFAAVGAGCAYFAGAFSTRQSVVAAAGLAGMFNPFLLLSVPAIPVMAAIAVMGALGGMIVRVGRGAAIGPWAWAAATVAACLLATNPALLAVVAVWLVATVVVAWAVGEPASLGRVGMFLARAVPLAVGLNAWWLVPWLMTLFGGEGIVVTAQTSVRAWSWTHARSSVGNVLTLTSSWAWPHREYFPWAGRLDAPGWSWLRYALPVTALAAPFVTSGRRRRASVALLGLVIGCVFVGKGLHPPFGGANLWLYDNVPGFWLLREPATKVGLIQVLAYVALGAMAVSALLDRRPRATVTQRRLLVAVPVAAAVAAVAFPFPLWTGGVVPDHRPLLPSAHVALPRAWRQAATFLNASGQRGDGKVLVLPLDDYYQMPTTWGYYGADVIAHSLLVAPVLGRLPGGYFSGGTGFESLIDAVERSLLSGDTRAVPRLLQALGVSQVVLRHDLDVSFPDRSFVNPDWLRAPLGRVAGLRLVHALGLLDIYQVDRPVRGLVRSYSSVIVGQGGPDALGATVSLATPAEAVGSVQTSGTSITVPVPVTVQIVPGGPEQSVAIDGVNVTDPGAERELSAGPHTVSRGDVRGAPALGSFSSLSDCYRRDARTPDQAGLGVRQTGDLIELRSQAHSACVSAPVRGPTPGLRYRVQLDYRTLSGTPARVCLWEEGIRRCAALPELTGSTEWRHLDTAVRIDPGTTDAQLFLYADGPAITQYRSLRVEPEAFSTVLLRPRTAVAPPAVRSDSEGPASYRVRVGPATAPFVLGLAESYSSGWQLKGLPAGTVATHFELDGYANGWRISGRIPDHALDLRAVYEPESAAHAALAVSAATAAGLALVVGVGGLLRLRRRLAIR